MQGLWQAAPLCIASIILLEVVSNASACSGQDRKLEHLLQQFLRHQTDTHFVKSISERGVKVG